jgi:AcrR family transcriptional regulator
MGGGRVATVMGAEHPLERLNRQDADGSSGHPEGCFLDCTVCARLRRSAVEIAVRDGIDSASIAGIADVAGLPLELATDHYPTADDCFAAAYDEGALVLRRVCARALRGEGSWQDRLHSAVAMAMETFGERPELARYCFVDAWHSTRPMIAASRMADRERLVRILAEQHDPGGVGEDDLPELRFEVLVGAAHHAVSEQLDGQGGEMALRERLDQLIDLFEQPATVQS